ncbi:hypothetical protein [Paenibacillus foliorum]|uniref:hypothetical protein n=1 Tax=Paenibacillus foliorum TaxID=2654974 RepID=UPI0028AB91C2|nr:hypothetical protein [Paenibacillus foliorum]
MNIQVTNKALCVGDVRIIGVSSSSVFLIGDTEQIICSSIMDTSPEAVIVGSNYYLDPEAKKEENKEENKEDKEENENGDNKEDNGS